MKQLNYQRGKTGEAMALSYLLSKNYVQVMKNFHNRFGEIDLVMAKNLSLIFVEVKLKIGDDFGEPEEMINQRKIQQIKNTAEIFCQQNPQLTEKFPACQIDAVCIVLNQDQELVRLTHWENIGDDKF